MLKATDSHIRAITVQSYNDAAREMADGVRLTHEQSDEIGDEGKDWLVRRLCLTPTTDDAGVTYRRS